jgi:hypothetical protein
MDAGRLEPHRIVESKREQGWLLTGQGFFSNNSTPTQSDLLFIGLDGTSRALRSTAVFLGTTTSRDGRRVALGARSRKSNVWMLAKY